MRSSQPRRLALWATRLALCVCILLVAISTAGATTDTPTAALKAAFLFNFAKFTEWPRLPTGEPIIACVVGDDDIANALTEAVQGQRVAGRVVIVSRPQTETAWTACQLLFIAEARRARAASALREMRRLPVLTVSDGPGFAENHGIVELFVEQGRMRFAINVAASQQAGLRLSSRVLGLAKVVGDEGGR